MSPENATFPAGPVTDWAIWNSQSWLAYLPLPHFTWGCRYLYLQMSTTEQLQDYAASANAEQREVRPWPKWSTFPQPVSRTWVLRRFC